MDKISEILNSVKERVSNPLIFSFLVSWLVYNWKIPVALIWFDEKQISANGCNSIFEFIENENKSNYNFWIPFGFAILYTFGFPIIKGVIKLFNTKIAKLIDEIEIKILDNGKVSMDKYLSLRNEYISKIEDLENIISEESILKNENRKLLESNSQLEKEKIKIYTKASESTHNDFLNGIWKIVNRNECKNTTGIDAELFRFYDGSCFIDNNSDRTFYVSNFINDWKHNIIYFVLKFDNSNGFPNEKFYYLDLRYNDTLESFEGTINMNPIKLLKQKI